MATTISQVKDNEAIRQQKNLTASQKKTAEATKEGVVVNNLVKSPNMCTMSDTCDTMVISDNTKMPEKLNEAETSSKKNLLSISLVATGAMAAVAILSGLVRHSAKMNLTLSEAQKIEPLQRNLSLNKETDQAIFQMISCTNQKTILAGTGVLTLSAMGFMGKMFIDGFKEIWVKKQEADIEKNLQEKLIAVETQSFAGKIQIMRSMLSEKAKEFDKFLAAKHEAPKPSFKGENAQNKAPQVQKNDNLKYFAIGALTLGAVIGLTFLTLKNLTKGKDYLEKTIVDKKAKITQIVAQSSESPNKTEKEYLKGLLQSIDAGKDYIKEQLSKLRWKDAQEKEKFTNDTIFSITKSTAKPDKAFAGDGTPKPSFYSHVDDYRAFFYNYLLDSSNPVFKNLFFGITGMTAVSYAGGIIGEGVKEVQVKKMNAQTELSLQQRLVSTELRNFKAKKDADIKPLCDEFYTQANKGKSPKDLKIMADNILYEIKNGPPFVYS